MTTPNKFVPFIAICFLFLVGCIEIPVSASSATPTPTQAPDDGFDRGAMLADMTNNVIVPAHNSFVDVLAELETAVSAFTDNPNEETLAAVQEAWLIANLARMELLPFRVGAVDDSLLHNRLDNRPPRTKFIDETILAGEQEISNDYLASIGSSSVGLGAMEYILFAAEEGNTAVLDSFTGADATRRQEYLLRLAQNMHQRGDELAHVWAADGDNYALGFVTADMDGGDLQSSINMLVNQIISDVENIVMSRLGKPSGQRSNGAVRPDLAEAPYSQASLARIIASVEGTQVAFNGGEGLGIDDYLDFLEAEYEGEPLSAAVNEQFAATIAVLEAIEEPLETAVETNLPQVETAIDETMALLVLLNVDVTNHLGVTLTFNDNDGD